MRMQDPIAQLALALLVVTTLAGLAVARSLVVAQPDEWLLCIRNGRLVKAGVGIYLWRRPGDVVVRFTSTLQRVGFMASALSSERLRVSVEGFILWSVAAGGDGPFRAFQRLGLVNLDAPPRDLRSPRHLLSTPQHRAFQQLLGAAAQRLAATRSLEELLLRQDSLVAELRRQLGTFEQQMGIRVEQVEISQVRPIDEELLRQMSAQVEERIREAAASSHLESEARIAQEQAEVRTHQLEWEKALRLAQVAHEHEVKLREEAIAHERALAFEARAIEVARTALDREELLLVARLDRIRREAEANRDAISAVASAEEKKSQGVRDHELGMLVAEKVGDALKELPIHEARWVTVGPDSPVSSLAALISAGRELTGGTPTKAT
jgi:hypothetical protein